MEPRAASGGFLAACRPFRLPYACCALHRAVPRCAQAPIPNGRAGPGATGYVARMARGFAVAAVASCREPFAVARPLKPRRDRMDGADGHAALR